MWVVIRRRSRNCSEVGRGACKNDDSHRGCLRGNRPHGIGNQDRDDVFTNTGPNVPGFTARHRSSWSEVLTKEPVLLLRYSLHQRIYDRSFLTGYYGYMVAREYHDEYRERDIAAEDYGNGNFWFVVEKHTCDCSWETAVVRWCPVPTSLTPISEPYCKGQYFVGAFSSGLVCHSVFCSTVI